MGGDPPLQLARLAAVLGQLDRPEAIGERGEAAARVDRRKLGAVADEHHARRAPGGRVDQALERARRHHRGLVHDDHRARRDGVLLSALDPAQQERGGLRRDARPRAGARRPPGPARRRRSPGHPSARRRRARPARVNVLPVPARASITRTRASPAQRWRTAAAWSAPRVGRAAITASTASGSATIGAAGIATGGGVEQAHLGAQHVGGGEERLAPTARRVVVLAA